MLVNPFDLIKTRKQVTPLDKSSMINYAKQIAAKEGYWGGLWKPGFWAQGHGNGIGAMGRIGMYPYVRDFYLKCYGAKEGEKPLIIMMASGSTTGAIAYGLANPVYQVKTLQQAESGFVNAEGVFETGARVGQKPMFPGFMQSLGSLKLEGNLYRGAGALVCRGACMGAGQNLGYDGCKTFFKKQGMQDSPVLHVVAAVAGAFFAATFSTPADLVMTRFQSGPSMGIVYSSQMDCARQILAEHGPLGFYRGYIPAFLRLCPIFSISLPLVEQYRRMFGLGYLA